MVQYLAAANVTRKWWTGRTNALEDDLKAAIATASLTNVEPDER
jgi:hypothetical protein